ncbi:MAG TPA: DNA adenine methylase [Terriglobia bacterium]|nr:DNA adenine methylase [Terriglobia bacterium]
MKQLALWPAEINSDRRIVNVAEIPQRSPFRYPGGKTWLVPSVRAWLRSLSRKPKIFIEPFVGGGIISLTVAFENLADHVLMVEIDSDIAAFWQTILSDDNDWLAEKVVDFDMSAESVREEISTTPRDTKHHAFQTLLRNRIYHGGILAPGSGMVKYGENGKGIKSRWYPQTLRKRIRNVKMFRNKITFIHGDGIDQIIDCAGRKMAVFFIDPPYTAGGKRAGSRLYTHNEIDHEKLFVQTAKVQGDFLMTYDNDERVLQMASDYGFSVQTVPMRNTHHNTMYELLIGRDLSWVVY